MVFHCAQAVEMVIKAAMLCNRGITIDEMKDKEAHSMATWPKLFRVEQPSPKSNDITRTRRRAMMIYIASQKPILVPDIRTQVGQMCLHSDTPIRMHSAHSPLQNAAKRARAMHGVSKVYAVPSMVSWLVEQIFRELRILKTSYSRTSNGKGMPFRQTTSCNSYIPTLTNTTTNESVRKSESSEQDCFRHESGPAFDTQACQHKFYDTSQHSMTQPARLTLYIRP